MKKKGIFYALLSILFVSLVIFIALFQSSSNDLTSSMAVYETRIYTLNDFVSDVEKDLGREVYITGFRALSALVDYIVTNGELLDNTEERFKEAFINGTVNNKTAVLMNQSMFDDWLVRIQNISNDVGLDIDIELKNVSIYHSSPWIVNISTNFSVSIIDNKGVANWSRNISVEQMIDINGFEDPLYVLNSYGRVSNIINQTIYEGNYTTGSGPGFDPSNLGIHANNSLYAENTNAPSYLMRFTNNLSASQYGIESIVNLEEFNENGLDIEEKSAIDHIYFSNSTPTSYHVNNMPSWFMIDANRTAKYQVTGETY